MRGVIAALLVALSSMAAAHEFDGAGPLEPKARQALLAALDALAEDPHIAEMLHDADVPPGLDLGTLILIAFARDTDRIADAPALTAFPHPLTGDFSPGALMIAVSEFEHFAATHETEEDASILSDLRHFQRLEDRFRSLAE